MPKNIIALLTILAVFLECDFSYSEEKLSSYQLLKSLFSEQISSKQPYSFFTDEDGDLSLIYDGSSQGDNPELDRYILACYPNDISELDNPDMWGGEKENAAPLVKMGTIEAATYVVFIKHLFEKFLPISRDGIWEEDFERLDKTLQKLSTLTEESSYFDDDEYDKIVRSLIESYLADMHYSLQVAGNEPYDPFYRLGVGGACGGPGAPISVTLKSVPSGARIWFATVFDFELCKLNGNDPWDLQNCPWDEKTGNSTIWVGGNYQVYARWPDGSSIKQRREIDIFSPGDVEIEIRK